MGPYAANEKTKSNIKVALSCLAEACFHFRCLYVLPHTARCLNKLAFASGARKGQLFVRSQSVLQAV